jgi:porin
LGIIGALFALLLMHTSLPAAAAPIGSVSGIVSDATGAVMPGVTVRVQNTASNETQSAVTNASGLYTFPGLAGGTYELRVEQDGFRPFVQGGLLVTSVAQLKVNARLFALGGNPGETTSGAQDDPNDSPRGSQSVPKARDYAPTLLTTKGGFMRGIGRRDAMLGDAWGLRRRLSGIGISLDVLETSEVLGNVSGGVNRGAAYDGLTQLFLQLDTQRAFRWYGGTFNVSALQIHGRNLSTDNLYSLQTASGIQSNRATRLWELWYDQKFGETDKFDLKIGQQSLDQEFMVSQNALLFVNTMFGWAMLPSADLPGGGPAYPLAALGVRGRVRLANSWTLLAGVFTGSPAGNTTGDAQEQNSSGTMFPLSGGALAIAELQYSYPSVGTMVYGNKRTPLPRVYKLGVWHDSARFDDQRLDNTGLSLAHPASSGEPLTHKGDYAFYAVADQMIWQSSKDYDRSLNVFARVMGTPLTDRNLIDFSLNAGFTFNEPIKHRDDDVFGIGMGYAHVSSRAGALDRDYGLFTGSTFPVRNGETFVEASYRYQLRPWWQLQPTFQYVFNPGAGIINPNSPSGKLVKNEAVIGLRMNFAF